MIQSFSYKIKYLTKLPKLRKQQLLPSSLGIQTMELAINERCNFKARHSYVQIKPLFFLNFS